MVNSVWKTCVSADMKGSYKGEMKDTRGLGESVGIGVNEMPDALVGGGALVKDTGRGINGYRKGGGGFGSGKSDPQESRKTIVHF